MNQEHTQIIFYRQLISLFIALVLFNSLGCQSKTVVKKLTKRNAASNTLEPPRNRKTETDRLEGVVYRLPRTVVQVSIPIKKVTKEPGIFKDYAPCFFTKNEVENSTQETSVQYSVEKPVFSSRGEPDPSETYVVKTKGHYLEAKTVFMEYTPSGLLSKGEAESTNNSLDFTLKAIGTVAGLAVNVAKSLSGVGTTLRTATTDESGRTRQYVLPDLNCVKRGFLRSKTVVERNIQSLITSDARLNITLPTTEICFRKAEGEVVAGCPFVAAAGDAKILKKLIELLSAKEILDKKILYIDKSNQIERKEAAKVKKVDFENQLSNAPKTQGFSIKKKIASTQAEIIGLGNPEAGVDLEIGREVENDYARAAALFIKLETLQTRRDNLVSTAANVPPDTFKEMLSKTETTITDYRAVFLGGSDERTWTGTVDFTPNITPNDSVAVQYAEKHGLCTVGTLIEQQKISVSPKFLNRDPAANPCDRELKISVNANSADSTFAGNVELANTPNNPYQTSGWYYRIPSRGNVELKEVTSGNTSVLGVDELTIAQFGKIVSMPAKTAGKTSSSSIVLDEATGALKNFKVSSSPLLDENTLKDAQSAAETVINASDPVTRKKRELELLQLQNQINEARKTLNDANEPNPAASPQP